MTDIDVVRCMDCGREDTDPDVIPQQCPDCGASLNNYYKEKIFGGDQ